MRKLIVFNSISLDGYFTDGHGAMDWAHSQDPEWNAFVANNAKGGGMLVLGRVTYDLMIQFWPTPLAAQIAPVVAERMNTMPKVVFSRTLDTASWNNTELVKSAPAAKLRELKQQPGNHITILGSGNLIAQLAEEGLIDEYQFVVVPVVLGAGRTMFEGIGKRLDIKLSRSQTFGNGNVFLCYEQKAQADQLKVLA